MAADAAFGAVDDDIGLSASLGFSGGFALSGGTFLVGEVNWLRGQQSVVIEDEGDGNEVRSQIMLSGLLRLRVSNSLNLAAGLGASRRSIASPAGDVEVSWSLAAVARAELELWSSDRTQLFGLLRASHEYDEYGISALAAGIGLGF